MRLAASRERGEARGLCESPRIVVCIPSSNPAPAADAGRLPGAGRRGADDQPPAGDEPVAQAVCNGVQISYDDNGLKTPRPPIVFLHAHGLNRSMWDRQKLALRGEYRVVTYDLRGHGRSEKPPTGYGRDIEVADLAALLEHVRIARAHLVGLSRGAGVALAFAAAHPEKTASIIAMGAGYDFPRFMPDFADQRLQTMATLRAEGLRAAKDYWSELPIFAPLAENEDAADWAEEMLLTYTGAHWLDQNPPQDASLAGAASRIAAPALLLVGEKDLSGFHACAEELASKIEGAERMVVPGVGHLMAIEDTERVTGLVSAFLAKQR